MVSKTKKQQLHEKIKAGYTEHARRLAAKESVERSKRKIKRELELAEKYRPKTHSKKAKERQKKGSSAFGFQSLLRALGYKG